jgi:tetratricopeptide (TPR) repeat protein
LRAEQFVEFRRDDMSYADGLRLAIPLLRQVLEIEPGFIDGWLDLAKASYRLSGQLAGEQAAAMLAQYYDYLEKARQLDPDHPVVLAWQAGGDFGDGVDTQTVATRYEMSIGRVDKALAMAELAVDRDPKCADCWYVLSQILRDIGRHGESVDAAEIATALGMDLEFSIAKTRLYQHDPDAMLALFDDNYPDYPQGLWAYTMGLYTVGRMAEFDDVFADLRDDWGDVVPFEVAMVYAWSGKLDAAFEWLRTTIELNAYELQLEYRSPFLFNLHGDPRWEEILRKIERHPEQLAKIEFDPEIPAVNR